MKTIQWAHQRKELNEHWHSEARAWLWQMRTGKSKMAIDNACQLAHALEIRGVVVIAPNGVHRNWIERELPLHHWDFVPYNGFAWRNSDKDNTRKFMAFMARVVREPGTLHWLAVNMESLIIERTNHALVAFIRSCVSTLGIYDESHHFAVPGAKRTGHARGYSRLFSYRRILTGTPVENSPLQAFSQYELLHKTALGFRNFTQFKSTFADYETAYASGGRGYPRLVGYKNLATLRDRMAPFTSVVLRSDVEELPPVQQDARRIQLGPTLRKRWDDCKSKVSAFFSERGALNIPDGGAALIKLQQIEGGFWKQDERIEQLVSLDDNPKIQAVKDEIEQHDSQVIVWCAYRHEIDALAGVFGEEACKLYGGSPDRQRTIEEFRSGKYRVAVAQPRAVGEGQDLSTATKIIWYSQTPDAILRAQANERATAKGKGSVQIVDLVSFGGVDEYFLSLTQRKVTLADAMSRDGMVQILNRLKGD